MFDCLSRRKEVKDETRNEPSKHHDYSESCLPSYLELDPSDSHTYTLPTYQQASFEPVADKAAEIIDSTIQLEESALRELGSKIHKNPELAFNEHYAADILTHFMQCRGWKVEKGICGLDTAWRATFKNGRGGSTVGFNAEMDVSMISSHDQAD